MNGRMESNRIGLMGLSIVTRLQQSLFTPPWEVQYAAYWQGRNLICYRDRSGKKRKEPLSEAQKRALSSQKFTGVLSKKTISKMTGIIQNWMDTTEHFNYTRDKKKCPRERMLSMITVTLSSKQQHSDNYIKRNMLNRLLIYLIRKEPSLKYLWKAETQKNGNIHFHILIDKYIDKTWLLDTWNVIQMDHGYVRNQEIPDARKTCPSTRIEALRDKYDGSSYCAKYMSKNEGERRLEGRLWGCSNELKELKKIVIPVCRAEIAELIEKELRLDSNLYIDEYACIIKNVQNFEIVKANMISRHSCVQMVLESNIDKLNLRQLCPEFSVYDTEWWSEILRESSGLPESYLHENGLLFGF
jgi:hypothetical protein